MRVLKCVSSYKMYINVYSVAVICESFSLPGARTYNCFGEGTFLVFLQSCNICSSGREVDMKRKDK